LPQNHRRASASETGQFAFGIPTLPE